MRKPAGTIVVGYDFSDAAEQAVRVAFSIAPKTKSSVLAVMVLERRYERHIADYSELFFDGRADTGRGSAVERTQQLLEDRMETRPVPVAFAETYPELM